MQGRLALETHVNGLQGKQRIKELVITFFCEHQDKKSVWTGGMAPLLRALVLLAEDLGLILSTHMTTHNHLELQFRGIWHPLLVFSDTRSCMWYTNMHVGQTALHIKNNNEHDCKSMMGS